MTVWVVLRSKVKEIQTDVGSRYPGTYAKKSSEFYWVTPVKNPPNNPPET